MERRLSYLNESRESNYGDVDGSTRFLINIFEVIKSRAVRDRTRWVSVVAASAAPRGQRGGAMHRSSGSVPRNIR